MPLLTAVRAVLECLHGEGVGVLVFIFFVTAPWFPPSLAQLKSR